MTNISVVIIAKNEANVIGETIKNVKNITTDVVVVDSGSIDETVTICKNLQANVIEKTWKGYGQNKNKGNIVAQNNWIFSLDADEMMDDELKKSLENINFDDEKVVYKIHRKNYFGNQLIKYGDWGKDKTIRLFNRHTATWNTAPVHEKLLIHPQVKIKNIQGNILHHTVSTWQEYKKKTLLYAKLNAIKYKAKNKKATFVKQFISPVFSFFYNYILKLGFLDGKLGFKIAKTTATYTYLKYKYLKELNKSNDQLHSNISTSLSSLSWRKP